MQWQILTSLPNLQTPPSLFTLLRCPNLICIQALNRHKSTKRQNQVWQISCSNILKRSRLGTRCGFHIHPNTLHHLLFPETVQGLLFRVGNKKEGRNQDCRSSLNNSCYCIWRPQNECSTGLSMVETYEYRKVTSPSYRKKFWLLLWIWQPDIRVIFLLCLKSSFFRSTHD